MVELCPIIDQGGDEAVVVLDPRAVIVSALSGRTIYEPRSVSRFLDPWVRDWLRAHPEWATVGVAI